jgi:hypothetical protein
MMPSRFALNTEWSRWLIITRDEGAKGHTDDVRTKFELRRA